ncbi:MAG: DNA polymerase domain-containing protein [Clostridia bacterium]|nr:DNA polymerase domain-containing protein [Clostridia bacterium]
MNKFGYRTVWYDARKKCVHLWTWDDQGNRIEKIEPFKPYLFVETTNKSDAISIYGTNLRKLVFPSQFERRRYVKECGIKRLFFNLKAEQQFLLETYMGLNDAVEFSENPLKIYPIDIEVYAPNEFPKPEEAKYPINLITIYDSITKKFHTFGTKPYTTNQEDVIYHYYPNERIMLTEFLNFWTNDYPDVVTGWNSDGFDIPYIINRITQILGEDAAKSLSPVNSIYYKEDIAQKYGKTVGRWVIYGISVLDYMEVYQTFSREKRESYNLNYIGKVEEVGGKTKFNATSLAKLSENDWNTFVEYNIQDVNILVKLENKLRFLKTMRIISHKGFCNLEATLGKVTVVSGAIAAQALKRNQILCTFENDDMGNYSGGFVKEIPAGLKESVITFDADSLYPNCIITLNLSPETKIGKVMSMDKEKDEIIIKLVNGKEHTLTKEQFISFLQKEKISISKAKILFSQKVKGIVPEYVDGLYAERVANKNAKKAIEHSLDHCKKESEKYIQNVTRMEQLDILQYTLKILLNSIYGVFANKFGPLYDIDCAASITNTGQAVIKEASDILDQYAKEKYNIQEPITHYNDTDSCHCSIQPILDLNKYSFCDKDEKISPIVYKIAIDFNDILNVKINEWSANTLNSIDSRFHFKREAICSTCLYESKKHYILHVKDKGEKEPLPCDKIKPVGVELVKTTMSDTIKKMIEEIVKTLLKTRDRTKTLDVYREQYESFKKLQPDEIAFRSSIKTYNKYSALATGFSKGKGTPVAVAGAIYYNNLLKEYNLTSKYEELKSEDRVKWLYVLPTNQYNITKIAFADKIPEEFVDIKPDYDKMFKKILEPAITRLFECAQWKMADLQAEYTIDLLDLFKL